MNLVDRYTEKVEICSNDEEDWDHEGEDKVDVVVQPTVITRGNKYLKKNRIYFNFALPEAVNSFLVEESVHEERAENNEERTDVSQQVILNKPRPVRLEHLHQQHLLRL